jgi:hypothetical protein
MSVLSALRQLDNRLRRTVIGVAALALLALGVQPCAIAGPAPAAPAGEASHAHQGHAGHHGMHDAGHLAPAAEKAPATPPAHCGDGGCAYATAVQPPSPTLGASADLPLQPVALAAPSYQMPALVPPPDRRFTEYRSPPLPKSPILEHRVLRI